jgi:hypothetical protein
MCKLLVFNPVLIFTVFIFIQEKYGPKGQNKPSNGVQGKADKPKPNADVDINVGLSTRPPWFCRFVNLIL